MITDVDCTPIGPVIHTNTKKYTEILEVNLFAFAYRLFHEDFSSIEGAMQRPVDGREIFMKQSVGKCKQINF